MEGLIELGRRSVKDMEKSNHFQPSPRTCSIIEVWPKARQTTSMTRIDANESQLCRKLQHQGEHESEPLFKLVCIWRDEAETLYSSQPNFLLTFDQLGLSPASLYLISRNCYGLHVFDDTDSRRTFFVGTVMYALVWTHDSHASCTRALLLLRTGCGLSEGETILDELVSILELYESHVGNQHYLQYVLGLHISRFVDESIQVELEFIRNMESRTGYGSWTSGRPSLPQPDVRKLAEWSAKIGASVVNLANQVRHVDISRSLVSFIQDDVRRGQPSRHSSFRPSDLSALLPSLEKQIASQLSYIAYLQVRAKSLSTVTFALLAREDALAGLSIADKSGRDSSSMKTIAVMTMAFLPGTFFAALFAIPSLDWAQSKGNFWVYWAFTAPSTVAVFCLWYLITRSSLLHARPPQPVPVRRRRSSKP